MEIIVKLVPLARRLPCRQRCRELLFILSSKTSPAVVVRKRELCGSTPFFPLSFSASPIGHPRRRQRSEVEACEPAAGTCSPAGTFPPQLRLGFSTASISSPAFASVTAAAGESLAHVLLKQSAVDFKSWQVICRASIRNSLFTA